MSRRDGQIGRPIDSNGVGNGSARDARAAHEHCVDYLAGVTEGETLPSSVSVG